MAFETISSKNLDRYLDKDDILIIDLRSGEEYGKAHIKNAINYPYETLMDNINHIPITYNIILYCERGGSSLLAARELDRLGYSVKTVIGGINSYKGKNLIR